MKPARRFMLYAIALGTLALVFAMYTRPDFMMTVANQVWSCF